ncbi:hypothetical protein HK104_009939 [Borealophlyctis nickersoniae]|nr:hypothetical protein HK104_009939 [Borealophlyctis nickersoniae]
MKWEEDAATNPNFAHSDARILLNSSQQEANTWTLVKYLLVDVDITPPLLEYSGNESGEREDEPDDTGTSTTPREFLSDQALVDQLFRENKKAKEHLIVKQWLEATAPHYHAVETRPVYLLHTRSKIALGSSGDLVSAIDPDAPNRQHKQLAVEDQDHEKQLIRTVFEYIRRGRMEDAMDLCKQCDQPWRAASLRGGSLWVDSVIDENVGNEFAGNLNRELWKAICYKIASDESFDQYERAVYAYLAGDVQHALPVCTKWEDHVWIQYQALLEADMDECIRNVPTLENMGFDGPVNLVVPTFARSPEDIFQQIHKSENEELRKSSEEPFHEIQRDIILSRIDQCLQRGRLNEDASREWPNVSRFLAHLGIVLLDLDFPVDPSSIYCAILAYASDLIAAQQKKLIALYAHYLPSETQVELYANFLRGVDDRPEARMQLLEAAHHYGLDVQLITHRTVELIFRDALHSISDKMPKNITIAGLKQPISRDDERLIRALEWLTYHSSQNEDLLINSNVLMRKFLACGRANAASQVFNRYPSDDALLNHDWVRASTTEGQIRDVRLTILADAVDERRGYEQLLHIIKLHTEWTTNFFARPGTSQQGRVFNDWKTTTKTLTEKTVEELRTMLETDWLRRRGEECNPVNEEDEVRFFELQRVRDIYIPEIILWMHQMLYETRDIIPGNAEKSIQLADFIADSPLDYWRELKTSGKLEKFMRALRDSALAVADKQPWPWASGR